MNLSDAPIRYLVIGESAEVGSIMLHREAMLMDVIHMLETQGRTLPTTQFIAVHRSLFPYCPFTPKCSGDSYPASITANSTFGAQATFPLEFHPACRG